ncbi:O-succinylbenzoic acid--coaligase [Haloferula helveola]|uniref:O-succinylbenzoic acid--coaligase n=1 Tax=Haloferula helveola TaxID=490095 RepID=A0ABM7R9T8_9BACT|nr:O-succinylbenzoic acid--coaligase [Haloferula helveola]
MEATRLTDPAFWATAEPVAPGAVLPDPSADPLGLVWFRTSGSSGRPRWIGLGRDALLLSAAMVNRHLGVRPDDVWGLALPLFHVGGFGVAARAFEAGARLEVAPSRWDAARFPAWVAERGVNHLSLVPTQIHDLVAAGLAAPAGLRTVVVGGGVLAQDEGRRARKLGWPVLASYGMTEAGSQIATQSPELLHEPYLTGPIGILPHWEVSAAEDGRLSIRGASLFSGQLLDTGDGWRFEESAGEWYATGDAGAVGPDGLSVVGRIDSMVKILGELVDPEAVERRLGSSGAVVIAVPDARQGHRLVAVVEDRGMIAETERRVAAYNGKSPGPERIGAVVRVDRIPRSGIGKVLRAELSENFPIGTN